MKRSLPILAVLLSLTLAATAEAKHHHAMRREPRSRTDIESSARATPEGCCIKDADSDGDGIADRLDLCPNTPQGCKVDDYGCPWDSDQDGVCDGNDRCPNTPAGSEVDDNGCDPAQRAGRHAPANETQARAAAPAPLPPPPAPRSEVEKRLIASGEIRLENVYFESGRAKLLPESESSLNEAGQALEKFSDLKIEVGGHTDTRGPASYNMKLSQERAETVRAYLIDHFHLNPGNYVAKGYGESRPEVKEKNEEDRQRNRRVVLKVKNPGALPRGVEVKN